MTFTLHLGFVTTTHDFGGVLGSLWTYSFGLSQFHGHGSWLVCEVVLIPETHTTFPNLRN